MNNIPVISAILNIHAPFVRHPEQPLCLQEYWFFQTLSETCLPILEVFDRLDSGHIPFRAGISLSPTVCHMLSDELLLNRYIEYVDRRIEFGANRLKTLAEDDETYGSVKYYYNRFLDQRVLFTERYNRDILKVFDYYQRKGRVELLATSATYAYLPFFTAYPEAIQAQMEVTVATNRINFEGYPQGFWLPQMGWSGDLDKWLRSYNFAYTILDTHGLVNANPPAQKGSFYPVKTPSGIIILGTDFYARRDLASIAGDPVFRNNYHDLGYELPPDQIKAFLGAAGGRASTGFKCQSINGTPYNQEAAVITAKEKAGLFIKNRMEYLNAARQYMDAQPLCVCVFDDKFLGSQWYESPLFLESLFRENAELGKLQFMTPAEYIFKMDPRTFQTVSPEYSSGGTNGYAETWLDASNDWIYRHTMRALERMIELAERFPDNTGLKERALNQAAREILLALASDWPAMLYRQENTEYARSQLESALRNFTTIYEALGSNHISTEWLTNLERRHNIFPNINYRVFRRKK
ncbi:MAG: DUF1957 domain-containing protein [Treponema sp.]|nr:DUF1957 domain-containing protein [Treponema sp.]